MSKLIRSALLVVLTVLLSNTANAGAQYGSLGGVRSVKVVVSYENDYYVDVVGQGRFQQLIELELRRAGVTVSQDAPYLLYMGVLNVATDGLQALALNKRLCLVRWVDDMPLTIWESQSIGVYYNSSSMQVVNGEATAVRGLSEEFLSALLADWQAN